MNNPWCETLGCSVPTLESVRDHPEANHFAMLVVALLERGQPMTLDEVAERFEEAGVAPAEQALRSLKRCRPSRAPVYRDGDRYLLDPHDEGLDLWVFRLGLRPPRVSAPLVPRKREPDPLPAADVPLTFEELDQAWKDASLFSWSDRRLALAVLDAHGTALAPEDVKDFVSARTKWHTLRPDNPTFLRRGSPVAVLPDGRWAIVPGTDAVADARNVVRERLAVARRHAALRPDPEERDAMRRRRNLERAAHAEELAKLRRYAPAAFHKINSGGRSATRPLHPNVG